MIYIYNICHYIQTWWPSYIDFNISWNKGPLGSILRGNDSTRLKFRWAKLSNHCNRSVFKADFNMYTNICIYTDFNVYTYIYIYADFNKCITYKSYTYMHNNYCISDISNRWSMPRADAANEAMAKHGINLRRNRGSIELNLDCNYTSPNDLASNGVSFAVPNQSKIV